MQEHSNSKQTNKGGRPRKGSLEWRGGTWCARVTVTIDGESVRKWVRLETDNRTVARRKMARLLAEQPASVEAMTELATRGETYAELAARVTLRRASNGVIDVDAEDSREKNWILKEIGPLEVTRIRAEHILSIYDNARTADKSLSTLRNIRAILRSRFAVAIEEDAIQTSPMDRVRVPKAKIDRRERAVLTDEELAVYLSWQHPEKHRQLAVLQRQTMSALARVFGGLRTGDLHALEWKHFNVPDFTLGDRAPE